ncbi:lipopolysaccharide-induced tumor necrosis factor-alpha factor homolog [Hyposmocoma kahamanoa]|uniref:lipopolysaccharide-induced tumor necrosis factor-alpha factor homolog n=1 Tax=Hyposmocoma kahamanoa TaxID=1477025 RepID=UPI000E6D7F7D|nr:lipopolysaccharide-induced tumor necrosis factor-alpha factor homolog [Hyposmocoma kahamanoa]
MEGKLDNPPPYSQSQPQQANVQTNQYHPPQPPPVVVFPGEVIHQINIVSPVVVSQYAVGPKPSRITCRSCGADAVTRVEYKASTKTHLIALFLCLFGCWCCVCIPYCTDSCRNADHYCPNCNAFIGAHSS